MYPTIYHPDAPPGEKRVFNLIKQSPETDDWIVLHSLMLPRHLTKPMGEIDFVFLIPGRGILCLEVKSHRQIEFSQGDWLYGSNRKSGKNPFAQARDGMFSVRDQLGKKTDEIWDVPFAYGVCFPSVLFTAESIEWDPSQIIDQQSLVRNGIRSSLENLISETTKNTLTQEKGVRVNPKGFTVKRCSELLELLRPSFDLIPADPFRREEENEELLRLTNQQYLILDSVEANRQILITGPAGTGKTVITTEAFRRAEIEGHQAAYFCFNKHLADKLRGDLPQASEITIANIDAWLTDIAGRASPEEFKDPKIYFEHILPAKAIDAILERDDLCGSFDLLVIDEVQDLMKDRYLPVFDLILKGGIRGGRWLMAGDFTHQNVFSSGTISPEAFCQNFSVLPSLLHLARNCRNTPEIGTFVVQHTPVSPLYAGYLRESCQSDPEIYFYQDNRGQLAAVQRCVEQLISQGINPSDIVLLSPKRSGSIGELLEGHPATPFKTRKYGVTKRTAVRYSTVHGFKGLESYAVILTDIDSLSESYEKTLLYVAMTRAHSRLEIFCCDTVKPALRTLLLTSKTDA